MKLLKRESVFVKFVFTLAAILIVIAVVGIARNLHWLGPQATVSQKAINISIEFRIDGISEPLRDAEVPIMTPVTIKLRGLPHSAEVWAWSEPNIGKLAYLHDELGRSSLSFEYKSDVVGRAAFRVIVEVGEDKIHVPVQFTVKSPFPEEP